MEKIPLQDRINSFVLLGEHISQLLEQDNESQNTLLDEIYFKAYNENTWFAKQSVICAFKGLLNFLEVQTLKKWLINYDIEENVAPKTIGIIMAGNIPMVGFHDLLCVLISGNKLKAKLSTIDTYLMKYIAAELIKIEPRWVAYIDYAERLNDIDALVATGSDNTARHFDYYFKHIPRVIRRNRTACAILKGNESENDFDFLAKDVFTYFGLGCRNVTKLYVPEHYNFEKLLFAFEKEGRVALSNHKYANNYDYNKSILLVNGVPHLDNGYILLKEDTTLFSPISTLHYERYSDIEELEQKLDAKKEQIQCMLSADGLYKNSFAFGYAQSPRINDYADGVDTMSFLINLS